MLCSDGDLMEGVASEAASLAGHLKLDNLLWIYDDNNITIEGETELAFSEDVATRFEGLGWNALRVDDANDLAAIQRAIDSAAESHRQADDHRAEEHHRLRLAEQGRTRTRPTARRWAPTRSS